MEGRCTAAARRRSTWIRATATSGRLDEVVAADGEADFDVLGVGRAFDRAANPRTSSGPVPPLMTTSAPKTLMKIAVSSGTSRTRSMRPFWRK
ncbi:hypothetical protein ACFQX6_00335 [Streptosporangium lutulentum]